MDFCKVVSNLSRLRLELHRLFQLNLRRIEAADRHQVAAEQPMRIGIADVELKGLGQRGDGVADPPLAKQRIPEDIMAPPGVRIELEVLENKRLEFLKLLPANVIFKQLNFVRVIRRRGDARPAAGV